MFYRFEQVDEGIITGADVLDRLWQLRVTRMHPWEINNAHTARRMAKPVKMAFAGKNGCRIDHQRCESGIEPSRRTRPIEAALEESVYRTDMIPLRDFVILPLSPRNSLNARACS